MLSDRDNFLSMLVTMPIYSTYEKLSFVTDDRCDGYFL